MFLLCVGSDVLEPTTTGAVLLLDIALTLPLLARRRYPLVTLTAILLLQLGHLWVDRVVSGDLAVLFALYSVGRWEARSSWLSVAAAASAAWAVLSFVTWAPMEGGWIDLLSLLGTATAALALGMNARSRRLHLQALLDRATALEHERDQQAAIAVAEERSRIAREMHDVVAHSLSVMIALNDGAAAIAARDPEQATDVMRQASTLGRQALGEMRRLLGVLRDDGGGTLAPQPGDRELVALIDRVRAAGLPVDLTVTGPPYLSPAGAQLAVHRIVQESLTNVLKHARAASRATVRLNYAADHIDVEVSNDDLRPEPEQLAVLGHGLTGMRERVAVYGGRFHAGRGPDGSWRVCARLELGDRRLTS
jgi:signal transduction histidine kinase